MWKLLIFRFFCDNTSVKIWNIYIKFTTLIIKINIKRHHESDSMFMKTHKMYHTLILWINSTGRRSYKCPYCDKVFTRTNSELQKHMWIHEGVKPYKCPVCTYACRSKNNLQVSEYINRQVCKTGAWPQQKFTSQTPI